MKISGIRGKAYLSRCPKEHLFLECRMSSTTSPIPSTASSVLRTFSTSVDVAIYLSLRATARRSLVLRWSSLATSAVVLKALEAQGPAAVVRKLTKVIMMPLIYLTMK